MLKCILNNLVSLFRPFSVFEIVKIVAIKFKILKVFEVIEKTFTAYQKTVTFEMWSSTKIMTSFLVMDGCVWMFTLTFTIH